MAAADESGKVRKKEFADLMKGRDQIQVVGVPHVKWGLEGCTYRDNAVEGEVNNYRLTRGHTRMAPCQFERK